MARRTRRLWTEEEKRSICLQTTVPGVSVAQVANREKKVPREWITDDGMQVTDAFLRYAAPLIQGEASPVWENGVPCYLHL